MRKQRGFTLLEILITLVIFTVGIAAIMTVFSTGLLSSSDIENTTIGMNLAQRRIEEFRNRNYDTGIVSEVRAAVSGFSGFERAVAVTEPETDLKQVIVTTYWTFKGDDVSLSLITYISRN
jgi:prepilin-type N-terminal cleavage/methylation domain-containing protein